MEIEVKQGTGAPRTPRPAQRRGRPPKAGVNKAVIKSTLEAANSILASTPYGTLALTPQELELEAEALFNLIRSNAFLSKTLSLPFSNFALLEFIAAQWIILMPRVPIIQQIRAHGPLGGHPVTAGLTGDSETPPASGDQLADLQRRSEQMLRRNTGE